MHVVQPYSETSTGALHQLGAGRFMLYISMPYNSTCLNCNCLHAHKWALAFTMTTMAVLQMFRIYRNALALQLACLALQTTFVVSPSRYARLRRVYSGPTLMFSLE